MVGVEILVFWMSLRVSPVVGEEFFRGDRKKMHLSVCSRLRGSNERNCLHSNGKDNEEKEEEES